MVNWNEAIKINGRSAQSYDLSNLGKKKEAPDDPVVSKIVGRPVKANDARLISLVVKWKSKTKNDITSDKMDDFLHNKEFISELKNTFNADQKESQI